MKYRTNFSTLVFAMTGAAMLAAGAFTFSGCMPAASTNASVPKAPTQQELVAQGEHLVKNVGLCADCHTPRLPGGAFDQSKWLMGSPLGFKPLMEMPWADVAPPIAGMHAYTDEEAIAFLTTGARKLGATRPPMPEYRLSPDEAKAVLAYLRSLSPKS